MMFGQLLSNIAARALGRVGGIAAGVVATAVMARTLQPAQFGQIMFLMTLATVFAQLADFGTAPVFARLIADKPLRLRSLWVTFVKLRLGMAFAVMALTGAYLFVSDTDAPALWKILTIISVPFVAARFFDPLFQILDRAWYITLCHLVFALALSLLTVGAGAWQPDGFTFLAAFVVAHLVYVATAWSSARAHMPVGEQGPVVSWRHILATAVPLGIGSIFTTLNSRASVMILETHRTMVEVAYLVSALRVLDLAVAAAMVLITPLLPALVRAAADRQELHDLYTRILRLALACTAPLAIAGPVLAAPLVLLLYGPKYMASVPAVILIAWVGMMALLNILNSYVLLALNTVKFSAWVTGGAAALSIGLNLWLVPTHGHIAAAWTMIASEALMLSVTFALVYKRVGRIEQRAWLPVLLAGGLMCFPLYLFPSGSGLRDGAMALIVYLIAWGGLDFMGRRAARR